MAGKYEYEKATKIRGDKLLASSYFGLGNKVLGALVESMQYSKLQQASSTIRTDNGAIITATSIHGIQTIYIDVTEVIEEGEEFRTTFITIPASNGAYDGWGDPFYDDSGSPINLTENGPLGTIDGDYSDVIIKSSLATTSVVRYYNLVAADYPDGVYWGNADWTTSGGTKLLTWRGTSSNVGGWGSEYNALTPERFVGLQEGSISNDKVYASVVTEYNGGSPISESIFSNKVYYDNGTKELTFQNLVLGACMFIDDATGDRYIRAITGTIGFSGTGRLVTFQYQQIAIATGFSSTQSIYNTDIDSEPLATQDIPRNLIQFAWNSSGTEAVSSGVGHYWDGEDILLATFAVTVGDSPSSSATFVVDQETSTHFIHNISITRTYNNANYAVTCQVNPPPVSVCLSGTAVTKGSISNEDDPLIIASGYNGDTRIDLNVRYVYDTDSQTNSSSNYVTVDCPSAGDTPVYGSTHSDNSTSTIVSRKQYIRFNDGPEYLLHDEDSSAGNTGGGVEENFYYTSSGSATTISANILYVNCKHKIAIIEHTLNSGSGSSSKSGFDDKIGTSSTDDSIIYWTLIYDGKEVDEIYRKTIDNGTSTSGVVGGPSVPTSVTCNTPSTNNDYDILPPDVFTNNHSTLFASASDDSKGTTVAVFLSLAKNLAYELDTDVNRKTAGGYINRIYYIEKGSGLLLKIDEVDAITNINGDEARHIPIGLHELKTEDN